jgi:predicted RND superfamily exporter protein
VWREYENVRGAKRLRQLVDMGFGEGVITVLLRNANFIGTGRLIQAIQTYERERLAPQKMSVSFAGDVAVSQTLIDAIVRTQVQSVLGSLLGILLVTVILGRSLWFGILCVIPCSIAVLVNFAAMGWLSIPLGVATSMFASMALGIGVDYAIHLQSHWRRLRAEGIAGRAALIEAIATTGPAILIDTLAIVVGFGILTLSQVPANARLGGLVALSIGTCFATTILVLPALLATGQSWRGGTHDHQNGSGE